MRRRDTDRRCRKESKIVSVNKQICDTFTYNTILTMYMYLDKQDDSRFKGKHWINPLCFMYEEKRTNYNHSTVHLGHILHMKLISDV